MPDKQERYRKRNAAQGLQRVEVIVPEALAPYLKAYARALRDAHSLGLDTPLFDGMGRNIDDRLICSTTAQLKVKPHAGDTTKAPERRAAKLEIGGKRQSKPTPTKKVRPDFSKGLLDE